MRETQLTAAERDALVGDFASCWAGYRENCVIPTLERTGRLRLTEVTAHQMDYYAGAKSALMVLEAAERKGEALPELMRRLQAECDRFLQSVGK